VDLFGASTFYVRHFPSQVLRLLYRRTRVPPWLSYGPPSSPLVRVEGHRIPEPKLGGPPRSTMLSGASICDVASIPTTSSQWKPSPTRSMPSSPWATICHVNSFAPPVARWSLPRLDPRLPHHELGEAFPDLTSVGLHVQCAHLTGLNPRRWRIGYCNYYATYLIHDLVRASSLPPSIFSVSSAGFMYLFL
jgi:hypothetical protein